MTNVLRRSSTGCMARGRVGITKVLLHCWSMASSLCRRLAPLCGKQVVWNPIFIKLNGIACVGMFPSGMHNCQACGKPGASNFAGQSSGKRVWACCPACARKAVYGTQAPVGTSHDDAQDWAREAVRAESAANEAQQVLDARFDVYERKNIATIVYPMMQVIAEALQALETPVQTRMVLDLVRSQAEARENSSVWGRVPWTQGKSPEALLPAIAIAAGYPEVVEDLAGTMTHYKKRDVEMRVGNLAESPKKPSGSMPVEGVFDAISASIGGEPYRAWLQALYAALKDFMDAVNEHRRADELWQVAVAKQDALQSRVKQVQKNPQMWQAAYDDETLVSRLPRDIVDMVAGKDTSDRPFVVPGHGAWPGLTFGRLAGKDTSDRPVVVPGRGAWHGLIDGRPSTEFSFSSIMPRRPPSPTIDPPSASPFTSASQHAERASPPSQRAEWAPPRFSFPSADDARSVRPSPFVIPGFPAAAYPSASDPPSSSSSSVREFVAPVSPFTTPLPNRWPYNSEPK